MSDIQPTEADRNLAGVIRSECFVDISQTERPCFEWDVDTAAVSIAKYRADAVKAERERLCKNIKASIVHDVSKGPERAFFNLGLNSAINLILSDDQEARRG